MTSIVTFTYSDICKWRVALVRQEMLTRSGAPDFICLPFGWRIHFPCPTLSWHGMVIHFARKLLAPSWCCALFRLSFLVHMFGGSCTGRMCHLSCGIHAVYMLPILSEHGLWLDGKWFCLFDIRFVDDFWHGLNYNVVSCTICSFCKNVHKP